MMEPGEFISIIFFVSIVSTITVGALFGPVVLWRFMPIIATILMVGFSLTIALSNQQANDGGMI